jgi:hypothetical protein
MAVKADRGLTGSIGRILGGQILTGEAQAEGSQEEGENQCEAVGQGPTV